jgi:hypothetical protein
VITVSEYGEQVDESTVRFERLLPGPIEKVWSFLADSDKRGEWFTSGALPERPGEPFTMTFHQPIIRPTSPRRHPAMKMWTANPR